MIYAGCGTAFMLAFAFNVLEIWSLISALYEETRDYCLHETFNATCRPGFVILMTSAIYGRMKIGKCINGDFNIGCSKEVIRYFDSQCSAKESCDVSVRNLVDIHPCQRDFMSYLEASYKCIEATSFVSPFVCPRDGKVRISSAAGHIVYGLQHRSVHSPVGSQGCPWTISAKPGQTITLKIIILGDEDMQPTGSDETTGSLQLCSTLFVVNDVISGTTEVGVCVGGSSRERHLYSSVGNHVMIYMSRDLLTDRGQIDRVLEYPRFILSHEAIGCPDIVVPANTVLQRMGDNAMIKCNDTYETWYLSCQSNNWVGEVGNCSHKGVPLIKDDERSKGQGIFPTHGIVLAVLLGVALGIFIGMLLLLTVHCIKRSRSFVQKDLSMAMVPRKDSPTAALALGHCQTRRSNNSRTPNESNYPALIMNMDKIYEFDPSYGGQTTATPPGDQMERQRSYVAAAAASPVIRHVLSHHVTGFDLSYGVIDCSCRSQGPGRFSPPGGEEDSLKTGDRETYVFDRKFGIHGGRKPSGVAEGVSKLYDAMLYPPGLRTPRLSIQRPQQQQQQLQPLQQQQQQQQQQRIDVDSGDANSHEGPVTCVECFANG